MKQFYYSMAFLFLSLGIVAKDFTNNPVFSSGFIENKGQIVDQFGKANESVKYLFNMAGMNVQLKTKGFSYDTYQFIGGPNNELSYHRVDVELVGANPNLQMIGELQSPEYINMINAGSEGQQITGIRSFERVVYKNVYPDIDLVFERSADKLKNIEYNFVVHPGADASLIRLKYKGANNTALSNKKINISVANGEFTESIPASYLVSNYSGEYSPVKQKNSKSLVASYKKLGNDVYAFATPEYDKNQTLVIDPTPTLEWGTYYDGTNSGSPYSQSGEAVVYDGSGNVYMTGYTTSSQNISTSGAHQFIIGANSVDAFVVKFNSAGVRQWATYYGGNNNDFATNINIDATGNIYVCGYTGSPTQIASSGSHQTAFGGITGDEDAFVVKLNSNGVRQWGTYYGGSSIDRAFGVAVDGSGNVFLTGQTSSSSAISTVGSHQATYGNGQDAFLVKFNSAGVRQWGTYYGGTNSDMANEVAVDGNGDVYITGSTGSTGTVIATAGAFQTTNGQGFLAKFNTSGVRQWATFINASLQALTIDPANNIYITGSTGTTSGIATAGTHQTTITGSTDAIIMKFTNTGTRTWGTYYGGTSTEVGYDIAVDNSDNVYITGYSSSDTHINLISDCAYKTVPYHYSNGGLGNNSGIYRTTNMFIAKFDGLVGTRKWSTFFGGNNPYGYQDYGYGIAVVGNAAGDFYLTGVSHALNGTTYQANSFSEISHGAVDTLIENYNNGAAILAKFNESVIPSGVNPLAAPMNAINAFPGTTICSGLPVTLSLTSATLTPGASWMWYEYNDSDVPSSMPAIGTGTSIVVTNTIVGTKTYLVRAENSCSKSASRFIVIQTNPNPDLPNTTDSTFACQGASLYLYSNGYIVSTPYYTWTGPGGFSANTQSVIVTNTTTPANTGWYYITNTNSFGCEKKDSTYVRVRDSLKVTVTPSITICQGDSVKLNATSSLVGSSFTWNIPYTQTPNYGAGTTNSYVQTTFTNNATSYNNGFQTQINNSSTYWWMDYSGTYTLTVQNSGCQKTFTTPVLVRPAPTASITVPSAIPFDYAYNRLGICPGSTNTFSATSITGGAYAWFATGVQPTGTLTATSQNLTFTTSATGNLYSQVTYTVVDTYGCKNTANATIYTYPNNVSLTDTIRPCVGTSFNFSNSASAPSYTWTGPGGYTSNAVNPSFTSANAATHDGNYVANITTANQYYDMNFNQQILSCISKDSVRVMVKTAPTATITSNPQVCVNSPISFSSSMAPFVANYNYQWNSPVFSASGQTVTVYPYASGPTTVTLTLTDNFGCVGKVTTALMVHSLPTVTVVSNSPVCEGDSIRLVSTAPTATSFTWTALGTNTISSTQNTSVYVSDISSAGYYELHVQDVNGCESADGDNVSVKYTPILSASTTATLCSGNTINLNAYGYLNSGTALGGNLLHWTGPNTYTATGPVKTIPNATPVNSGNYVVSATLNGCTGRDSVKITVNPLPVIMASNNSAICAGDTLKLFGMPNNLNYSWNVPSGFNSSNQNLVITNASAIHAGTYTLTGTDANGCFSNGTTTVTINALPLAMIINPNSVVCEGTAISLSTNSVTGSSYQWSGPNGFVSTAPSIAINSSSVANSGTYSLTVTNSNGCKATNYSNVNVNYTPIVSASATNSVVCLGGNISLQANAYTSNGFVINGGSISWAGPNSFVSTGNTQVLTNATANMSGTYTITVSLGSCSTTQTVNVLVNNSAPSLTVTSNSSVCPGSAITLSVNPIPGATYSWNGPNGFSSVTQNPVINNANSSMTGLYTVTVSVGTCSSVGSTTVSVTNMSSIVPTSNSPVCLGSTINLNAPLISGALYAWTGPVSFTSANQNPVIGNATTGMAGVYSVTATFGSCSSTGTVDVIVIDPATITITAGGTQTVCTDNSISLNVTTLSGASYTWNGPNGYTTTVQNPTITNATTSMSGLYTASVNFGCGIATDSVEVTVSSCDVATIEVSVPEGFSPNGDGVNDLFVIKGIEHFPNNTITIFNRWGNELYKITPYANQWNGRAQKGISLSGDELPIGTYFYVLDLGDGSKIMKGYIYLTR